MKLFQRAWFILFSLFSISVLVISFIPESMPFVLFGLFTLVILTFINANRVNSIHSSQLENELIVLRQKMVSSDHLNHDSLQTLINDLPVGICFISPHGIVKYVNAPFIIAEQYPLKVNDTYHILQNNKRFYSYLYRTMLFEKSLSDRLTIGGQTYLIETQYHQSNEGLVGVLAMIYDINDFQAAQSRQTAFLADVTHELKTPISAIIGASEMLFRDESTMTSEERSEFISIISHESNRMNSLVSELLDLTRLSSKVVILNKLMTPLSLLVDDVINLLKADIEQKKLVVINQVSVELKVAVDQSRFRQVIINLLNNAIRYTPSGTITVKATEDEFFTSIDFTDTGIGIASADLPLIFDRFYRADKSRHREQGGSGIGLAVTKAIIEAHQGTIVVSSEVGVGTTFTIQLPKNLQ